MKSRYLFNKALDNGSAISVGTDGTTLPPKPQLCAFPKAGDDVDELNTKLNTPFADATSDPVNISIDGKTATAQFSPIQITGSESASGSISFNGADGSSGVAFNLSDIPATSAKNGDWYNGNTWDLKYKFTEYPISVYNVIISLPDGTTTNSYISATFADSQQHYNFGPSNGSASFNPFKATAKYVGPNSAIYSFLGKISVSVNATYSVTVKNAVTFTQNVAVVDQIDNKDSLTVSGGTLTVLGDFLNEAVLIDDSRNFMIQGDLSNKVGAVLTLGQSSIIGFSVDNSGVVQVSSNGTIPSYGIVDGALTNEATGIIQASSAGNLVLESVITNTGTIVSTGSASFLEIYGSSLVSNSSIVEAVSNGRVYVYGGTIVGGALVASTGGIFDLGYGSVVTGATLSGDGTGIWQANGGTLQNDTLASAQTLTVGGQVTTYLAGNLNNAGTVDVLSYYGALEVDGATSLSGHGTVVVSGNIVGAGTLTNVNNTLVAGGLDSSGDVIVGGYIETALVNGVSGTIEGVGYEGGSYLTIESSATNQGLIQAIGAGSLDLGANGTVTNTGRIQATGANSLLEIQASVSNKASISAVSNGRVYVYGGTIVGGALVASTGGIFDLGYGSVVTGATLSGDGTGIWQANGGTLQNDTLASAQTLTVGGQVTTYLAGNLNNAGTVDVLSYYGALEVDGATSLSGHGTVVVSGNIVGAGTLTNVNNVIQDYGNISSAFVNLKAGILNIENTNGMSFLSGVLNNGDVSVQAGFSVSIEGNLTGTGILSLQHSASAYLASVASPEVISLAGGSDLLTIANTNEFLAHVENFALGDQIDVQDLFADSFSYTGGKVTLNSSSGATLTFSLTGDNLVGHFGIKSDGSGGTVLFHT